MPGPALVDTCKRHQQDTALRGALPSGNIPSACEPSPPSYSFFLPSIGGVGLTFGRFGLARLALQWLWGRFTGAPIPSRPVGRTGAARSPGSRSSRSESASFSASLRSAAVPSESYAPSPSPDTGKRGKGGGRVKRRSPMDYSCMCSSVC